MSLQDKRFIPLAWTAAQWALLLSVFSYYFVENFVLSSGWEVLAIRSIDDYAMHDSIRRMQQALLSGRIRTVLTFFDYGYGNIFWLANAIAFLPLYFLDWAQAQIVLGRQISLGLIFASIVLVGRIAERLRPDAKDLKLPIMLALAFAPMIGVIGTKLHVNAQCIFFSVLAYHALVRDDVVDAAAIRRVATFAGIAVGLKLTAALIAPLIAWTLWSRLQAQGEPDRFGALKRFCVRFGLTSAACTLPALLLFPFFIRELGATYRTFQTYKNMGSDFYSPVGLLDSVIDAIGYSMHPAAFALIAALFALLAWSEWKRGRKLPTVLGLCVLALLTFVFVAVNKASIYLATYALSITPFVPLGLLGLTELKLPAPARNVVALLIVLLGAWASEGIRDRTLPNHRFFEIERSAAVVNQLQALEGMRQAIGPITPPLRVYLDSTTVFPATRFTEGVEVIYFYGSFREYKQEVMGRFDYVALNTEVYNFMMLPGTPQYEAASDADRAKADQEEAARRRFRETGLLGQDRYKLIYQGHQAVLYQRIQP